MANEGQKLDKLLDALAVMARRLDDIEQAGIDADKRRADARKRAKADAEAAKGKDAAPPLLNDPIDPYRRAGDPKATAADVDNKGTMNMSEPDDLPTKMLKARALRDQLYALENEVKRDMKVQGPLCEQEEAAMADAQARADSAYSALGKRAPGPLPGERLAQYRVRLLKPMKQHSKTWNDVDLSTQSGNNLDLIEQQIYADAQVFADSAEYCPRGDELVAVQKRDDSGRMITTFKGRRSFINQFKPEARLATITDPKIHELRELLQRGR